MDELIVVSEIWPYTALLRSVRLSRMRTRARKGKYKSIRKNDLIFNGTELIIVISKDTVQ